MSDAEVAELVGCDRSTVNKNARRYLQSAAHVKAIRATWQDKLAFGATLAFQRGLELLPKANLAQVTAFMRACADYAGFQGPNESEKLASVKATYIKNEVHVHASEGALRTTTVSTTPVRSDADPVDVTPQMDPSGQLRISSATDAETT